jgi:hypothetical protein
MAREAQVAMSWILEAADRSAGQRPWLSQMGLSFISSSKDDLWIYRPVAGG